MAVAVITGILLILFGAFFGSVHLQLVRVEISPFDPLLTGALLLLAALFSWRVYKTPIRYGWI